MPSEQQKHIQKIREEFNNDSQRSKDSLNNAIRTLSNDLYSKDTHFIFELIQNAEDNEYNASEPSLSFILVKTDPTGTHGSDGALIVQNNEIGFSPENIDAICAVGKSTKTKAQGYIGEKGIGFKSVFRISSKPYIFSNGYRFCLPEKDQETGLGYIVPLWVEKLPDVIDQSKTNIILPLDKRDFGYDKIKEMLMDIMPETILFLSKLKGIEIIAGKKYKISILKDDSKLPLVKILVSRNNKKAKIYKFLLYTKSFEKPSHINPEKRQNINDREVSIAFPLDKENESAGKIFAYLPVRSDTGLPFLINADFLLPSNREDIIEDEPWNIWLRDCISDVFTDAFGSWLEQEEYKTQIYNFIPLHAHSSFLKPIIEFIHKQLKEREIILTEPDGKKCKPEFTRMALKKFRNLLDKKAYPGTLLKTRLILNELEGSKKQLAKLGVKPLTLDEKKLCFQDRLWIEGHDYEWLLECYQFLASQKFETLFDCPIVPVTTDHVVRWTCDNEQPIYFENTEEVKQILGDAPNCICIPLTFLDQKFYEKVKDDKKSIDWMTKTLKIYPFSNHNYAVDVLNWFKDNYQKIDDFDIVSVTYFLSQFTNTDIDDIDFQDLPILLSDGRRMLLSDAKNMPGNQAIVTPECLDPETGWQNVFLTESDRRHLISLSNFYISNDKKCTDDFIVKLKSFWKKLQITQYPFPFKYDSIESKNGLTDHEKKCFKSSGNNSSRKSISNFRPLSWIKQSESTGKKILRQRSLSLLNLLSNQSDEWSKTIVKRFYNRSYDEDEFDSEFLDSLKRYPWLPSSKGFARPFEIFIPNPQVKEILGDTVSYFENDLPENIIELLEIRTYATAEELISILEEQSKNGIGSKEFAEKVYKYLNSLEDESLDPVHEKLKTKKIIFIPYDSYNRWVTSSEVIWLDQSDVIGDDLIYIEKKYPELKDFFVKKIGVKQNVDKEFFAKRWLKLQKEKQPDTDNIKKFLAKIYTELRPICKQNENQRPSWWKEFALKAEIWTQRDTFEHPESVFVPDDGDFKKIFKKKALFAWRPEHASFSDCEILYRALKIPYLSESVETELPDDVDATIKPEPEYLTDSAKDLILTYIYEKHRDDYERIKKDNTIMVLKKTREATCPKYLKVTYYLNDVEVESPHDCFWDHRADKIMFLKKNAQIKNSIARTIARGLMPNRAYKELADWIELVLCSNEDDLKYRIQQKGWRIPSEIKELDNVIDDKKPEHKIIDLLVEDDDPRGASELENDDKPKKDKFCSDHPLNSPNKKKSSGQGVKPEVKNKPMSSSQNTGKTSQPTQKDSKQIDIPDEFQKVFNRTGETKLTDNYESDNQSPRLNSAKIDRRREKETEAHQKRIDNEPNPAERRKKTMRTILEGADPQVRSTLEQWYGGKCQICQKTFPERSSGRPFFIANYMIPRKEASSVDTHANAICLCAEHFAKWQHGAVTAYNIIEQVNNLKLGTDGGDGDLHIQIKLCGENCSIKFNEKHVIALQELLQVAETNDQKNP